MSAYTEFIEVNEKLVFALSEMLAFEQEKRQALLKSDDKQMEAMLQKQQAAVMQLESLEKRRAWLQGELGLPGTLSDILNGMPEGPEKARLSEAAASLRGTAEELKELNKADIGIAKTFLQMYGGSVQDVAPAGSRNPYQQMGRTGPGFEQKI